MNGPSSTKAARALQSVDWNFSRSATPLHSVHTLHWFPGNFIPQIPRFLIEILSSPGATVLDPFCGSGTTGVEALMLGRASHQSDISPASIQVATGKVAVTQRGMGEGEFDQIGEQLLWDFVPGDQPKDTEYGSDPELQGWIHQDTLQQLRFIWSVIMATETADVRSMLKMIFSDTLFRCASPGLALTRTGGRRRHHWGWIADNVRPTVLLAHDALAFFRQRLAQLSAVSRVITPTRNGATAVKQEDVRHLSLQDESVDLIVTSPPYVGMIDYTLANRLDFLWMNWSIPHSLNLEIGARRHRNRLSGLTEYLNSMQLACAEMHRVLKPASFCAVVVGASRRYPDAVQRLIDVFTQRFDLCWGPTPRTPTRQRIAERKGSAPAEYVIVFRK